MTADMENIRKKLLAEAEILIQPLKDETNVLAAIITGSVAWGAVTELSDIDILLVVKEGEGIFYKYHIPRFAAVGRQTEFGYFPLDFLERESYHTLAYRAGASAY